MDGTGGGVRRASTEVVSMVLDLEMWVSNNSLKSSGGLDLCEDLFLK